MTTKTLEQKKVLHRCIVFIRNTLSVITHRRWNRLTIVNEDLDLARDVADVIHNLTFADGEEVLSKEEMYWINHDVKSFLCKNTKTYYVVILILDYVDFLLTLATEEQKQMVDALVLSRAQEHVALKISNSGA